MTPSIIIRGEAQREHAIQRIKLLPAIPEGDEAWAIWIDVWEKIRTLAQNRAYWRLITILTKTCGHDKHVWHEFFKRKAFGVDVDMIDGVMIEVTRSSAKAKRGDFSELIEFVQAWMAERGIPQ